MNRRRGPHGFFLPRRVELYRRYLLWIQRTKKALTRAGKGYNTEE